MLAVDVDGPNNGFDRGSHHTVRDEFPLGGIRLNVCT